jgi:hypothetical protein
MPKNEQKELNWKFYKAIRNKDLTLAQSLLDLGADVNGLNEPWWCSKAPPIIEAVGDSFEDTLKWLLQKGADPNKKAGTGDADTPLLWAMTLGSGGRVFDLLLEYGADPRITDNRGRSPISKIAGKKKKLPLLQKFQAAVEKIEEKKKALIKTEVAPAAPVPVAPAEAAEVTEVTFSKKLGSVFLEETFNFAARERITLVRGALEGPVQAVTRENFSAIEQSVLQEAFNAYQQKGGKIPESDVFPDRIFKAKMPGAGGNP